MVFQQHNGILLVPILLLPLFCTSGTACLRLDSSTAGTTTSSASTPPPSDDYSPSPSTSSPASAPTDSSSSSTSPSSTCSHSSASPSDCPGDTEALDEDAYDHIGKLKPSCDWSKGSCPGSKYSSAHAERKEGDSGGQRGSAGGGGDGGGVRKEMPKGTDVREGRHRKNEHLRGSTTNVKGESSGVMRGEAAQVAHERPKGGKLKNKPEKKETKGKISTGNGQQKREENPNKHESVSRRKYQAKEDKESKERQKRQTEKTVTKKQKKVESTRGNAQKKTDIKGKPVMAKAKGGGKGGGEKGEKRKGTRTNSSGSINKGSNKEEIRQEAIDDDDDKEGNAEDENEGDGAREEENGKNPEKGEGTRTKKGREEGKVTGFQEEEKRSSRTVRKEWEGEGSAKVEGRKREDSTQGGVHRQKAPSPEVRGRSESSRSNEVMEDEENEEEEEEEEEKEEEAEVEMEEEVEEDEEEEVDLEEEKEEEEEEEEGDMQEKEEEDEYEMEIKRNGPKKWRNEKMKLTPKKMKKYKKKNKNKNMWQQKRTGAKGGGDKQGLKANKKAGKKYEKKRKSSQKGARETKVKTKVIDRSMTKGHNKHWIDNHDRSVVKDKKEEKKTWGMVVEHEEIDDDDDDDEYVHEVKEEKEDNNDELQEEVQEDNDDIENEDENCVKCSKTGNKRNRPNHRKEEEGEKEEEEEDEELEEEGEEEEEDKEESVTEKKTQGRHKEKIKPSKGNKSTKIPRNEANGKNEKGNPKENPDVKHKKKTAENGNTKEKAVDYQTQRGEENRLDVREENRAETKKEEGDKMEEERMKEELLERPDMTIESSVRLLKSEKELKDLLAVGSVQVIYVYNRNPDATANVVAFLRQLERASHQLQKYDIILARVDCELLSLAAYCNTEEVNMVAFGFKEGKQRIAFPVDTLRNTNAIVASALHLSLVNAVPILQSSKERQELEGRCLGRYDIIFSYQTALGSYEHRVFLEVAYAFLDTYVFALTTYRAGALGLPDAPQTDPQTDPRHRSVLWILHCATQRPDEECVASPFYHRLTTHRLVQLFAVLQLPLWHALELTPSVKTISTPYDEHELPLVLLMYDDEDSADRVAALVADLALLFHGSVGLVTLDIRDTSASALASVRLNRRRIVTPAVAFFSKEQETTKLLNDYDDAYEFVNNQLRALRELVPLTKQEEGYDPIYDPPELQQDDEIVLAMKPEVQLAAVPPITEEQANKLIRQVSKVKRTKNKDAEGSGDAKKLLVIVFFLAWDPVSNMALQHLSVIPGAAEDLGLGVMVRRLDCYDWPGVCEAEGATTYPCVRFYTRGRNLTYTGPINSRHFLRSVLLLQEDLPRRVRSSDELRFLLTLKGLPQGQRQLIPSVATGIFPTEEGAVAFTSVARNLAPYQLSAIYVGKKAGKLCAQFHSAEDAAEDEDKKSSKQKSCVVVSRPDDTIKNTTVITDSLGDESTLNLLIRHASINIMGELTPERYGALSLGDDSAVNRPLTLFILFVPEDKRPQDGEDSSLKDGQRDSGIFVMDSGENGDVAEEEKKGGNKKSGNMEGVKKKEMSNTEKTTKGDVGHTKSNSQKDLKKKGHKGTPKSSKPKDRNQVHTRKDGMDPSTPLCPAQDHKRSSTGSKSCSASKEEEDEDEEEDKNEEEEEDKEDEEEEAMEKDEEEQKPITHLKEKNRFRGKGSLYQKDKKKPKEETDDLEKEDNGDMIDDGDDDDNDDDNDDDDDNSRGEENMNNELFLEKKRENKEDRDEDEETKEEHDTQKDDDDDNRDDDGDDDDDDDDDNDDDDNSDDDSTVLESNEDAQEEEGENKDEDDGNMNDPNGKNEKDEDSLHSSSDNIPKQRPHAIFTHKSKTTHKKSKQSVKVGKEEKEEKEDDEEEEDDEEDDTDNDLEDKSAVTKKKKDLEDETEEIVDVDVENIRAEIGRVFKDFHAPGIVFSWLNSKDQLGLDVLTAYGLPLDVPCLVALDVNQGQVCVYNDDLVPLKVDSLQAWVDGVLKGTVRPSIELPQTEWAPPIPSIDFLHFIRQDQERDSQRQLLSEMETELGMQLQEELGGDKPEDYGES